MVVTFDEYKALWNRIKDDNVYVRYDGSGRGEEGYFEHDRNPIQREDGTWDWGPLIGICRHHYTTPVDEPTDHRNNGEPVDLKREFITLAHEYGHSLSFRGGSPKPTWEAYHRAATHRDKLLDALSARCCRNELTRRDRLRARMSNREKRLIAAEETLAWQLGRDLMPDRLLPEYDWRARHGVHCHRFRMGMEGLWFEDIEPRADGSRPNYPRARRMR
jgi:hypothetical protein